MLVAIVWLLPVALPQAEDSPDKKPNTDSPFIVPKAGAGWTCFDNPNCWIWACAEKVPGGGCNAWEQKCTCSGGGGGGGPSYSPPTISHTFNCSIPGWGDWCIGTLSIELTASDPQNATLIISGDVNGNNFTCTENPCTIDLSEGVGNVNYKVDASTGLSDSDSTTYYVDVTTPQIDGSISGTSGTNNWFTTQTLVTASASDFNSGIASLEVNVNNTGYSPYTDTTFTDGVHTIQFRAYDNAGNLTETAIQTIMVDTITPRLSLQVDGTRGQNDFYTNSVTVTPIASDSGSGINKIEASVDNGIWTVINSPLFFADGNHSYQIRVTDNAGNVTETPVQSLYIDASPAVIAMLDDALILGDGLFYSIEDSQSGLSELRVVIKDNDGKYKSMTWAENLDGANKYKDSVWWDGIFPSNTLGTGADGTYPTPGIYYIALKVTNGAGVETIRTATIEVPVVKTAEQENLPALVLPALVEPVETAPQAVQPSAPQTFGNSNNPFTGNSIQTPFSIGSQSTALPNTNTTSNVLWGGAAAAMLGATLAEWQRQREEEAARLAALRNSGGGEEGDSDAADKKRMKVLARVNPAYARSLTQERNTRAAIAKVTAQEQKAWARENTLKVEATQAYKESENKGQYLKQELQNIRNDEAVYRAEQKAEEQAKIAAQNREEKLNNLFAAEAEMDAVIPVTPYVVSAYVDKEEETWLKGNESQRAWAAVNAQEDGKNTGGKSLAMPNNQKAKQTSSTLPGWVAPLVVGLIVLTLVIIADQGLDTRSHNTDPIPNCHGTYPECFNQHKRIDYTNTHWPDGNNLDEEQFDEMLDLIYEDMNQHWRTPFDPSRMVYDTPFWNGNARIMIKPKYPDEILCLDGKCSPRSAINYVGVGMYSARAGEPLWLGKAEVVLWNRLFWNSKATLDELYYFEYGYNAYIERDATQDATNSSNDVDNQNH